MQQLFTVLSLLFFFLACKKEEGEKPQPTPPVVTNPTPAAPLRTVQVATATELKSALLDAKAGDEIILAPGIYAGKFVVAAGKNGTAINPIILKGPSTAVLDAGSLTTGYVLHLQSNYWIIKGLKITNGLKGIMADGIRNCIIDSVTVTNIGDEGIHLRKHSARNEVRNCSITNVGLHTPDYGEGIYLGSAKSNWATYTNGLPDRSDSNLVVNNRIGPGVAAECIDIKEGTTGGIIRNNYFDATGIMGQNSADSWIDVKGNNYLIEANTGFNPSGSLLKDGYQVNVAYPGWGNNNEFRNNNCEVNAAGYGFLIKLSSSQGTAVGNKVYSSNQVVGAGSGITNIQVSN